MMNILKMGFRSVLYRKKQYLSLFGVCIVGVGFSLFILFLVAGMLDALESKAKNYYGGDLNFIGGTWSLSIDNIEDVITDLQSCFPEGTVITPRFDFDAEYSSFYFEGVEVRQRVIKGCDFEREKALFSNLNYVEGNADNMADSTGVLLSMPIAQKLGVHVNDSITFLLKTSRGYTNTVTLQVQGIFKDSSLFGMYTSYMDINTLRSAYDVPAHWGNRICITLPNDKKDSFDIADAQSKLEEKFTMFPLVEDKQQFYDKLGFSEPTYALIALYANLEDLKIILDAMNLITVFIIVILLIIVIVGISTTYRVIVMKRINEIGIYKAIGMQKRRIYAVLLSEICVLLAIGFCGGVFLSFLLSWFVRLFNLSFVPAFDIFLVNGVLLTIPSLKVMLAIGLILFVTTLIAVLFSIRKSVSVTPVVALGTTE